MGLSKLSYRIVMFILVFGIFAACETISDQQCRSGNWESIGHVDGSNGIGIDRFQSYVKKCGKSGIQPDYNAYKTGRQKGLRTHCHAKGRASGLDGDDSAQSSLCMGTLESHYASGYSIGLKSFCTYQKGKENGLAGQPSKSHVCPQGVLRTTYIKGYQSGMSEFCNPRKAFSAGKKGKKFDVNLCPRQVRSRIRRGFEAGKEVALIESEIKDKELHRKIRRAERERYDLKRDY